MRDTSSTLAREQLLARTPIDEETAACALQNGAGLTAESRHSTSVSRSGSPVAQIDLSRPPSRPSRTSRKAALFVAGLLLLAVGLLAERYLVPEPVELVLARRGVFQPDITGPGTLDAISKANVSSSVQGVITSLYVDRNDPVRKGAIIAEVNAQDLAAQLDASIASQTAASRAVEAADADIRRAEATLANARATLARQQDLVRTGTTSKSALESAETSVRQAEADVDRARSTIRQAEAQEKAAVATVEMNRAQADKAVIRAPIDGVVVRRALNLGDLVSPGAAIVEIVDPESIVLTARFDESSIASVFPGQTAIVQFISQGGSVIDGRVRRISREVDSETREFTVDITPARLPVNWAVGQRGIATIGLVVRDDAIAVPSSAIQRRDAGPGVWAVEDGRAVWRPVDLGAIGGDAVEIRDGLKEGESVIVNPIGVYPLMRVQTAGRRP